MVSGSRGFGTRCIHAGEGPDPTTGAHGIPLYQNVTYAFATNSQVEAMRSGERPHFTYSSRGNPTVRSLEAKLANLEGAEASLALNSGMAAISAALIAAVGNCGHIVASDQLYDQTQAFLANEVPMFGGSSTFVDTSDLVAVERAITPATRAIYAEPFSNPRLTVSDPRALAEVAHHHGLLLIIDNTFLSPALLRPISLGADVVVHSATKYLSGHGHVQGGIVSGPRSVIEPMRERSLLYGTAMSPFAAWLLLAGTRTLPLRMARHSENAMRLARMLADHPAVADVLYPGLIEHPQYASAASFVGSNDTCFGGMLSFTLRGGAAALAPFIDTLELSTIAVSLGDCSTLVWPWYRDDLVRVSTGLEDFPDLESDFLQALAATVSVLAAD